MLDVYKTMQVRKSLEYEQALLDSIYKLIGTEDPEVWGDGQVKYEEERESVGVTIYSIQFRGDEVGKIRAEVFENESFKFEEIS